MTLLLRQGFILLIAIICFSASAGVLGESKKVSLIFVGPAKGLSESSFGHVAMKLSPDRNGGLLDMVVEFVADVPREENPMKKYIRGAGLGKKYPVKAELLPFYDFRKKKTITENRSLTVYDLKLSQEQVNQVVDFIENYQNQEVGENYLFLTKNCSYFAAHAIEVATGKKVNNKNFPWKVDNRLRALGLIENEALYPDASSERERLAQKFLNDGLGDSFPIGWKETFVSHLGELSITLRQSSYLKLLWLQQTPKTSEKEKRKSQALLRYLLSFENDVSQFTIRNLFRNPEQKHLIILPEVKLQAGSLPKEKTIRHDLVIEKNLPVLKISWGGPDQARVSIPLKKITFEDDFSLKYNGIVVGRFIRTKSARWILSQRLDYGVDVDRKQNVVRTILYVDLSEGVKDIKKTHQEHKDAGIIAINNSTDFQGEMGSCYALTLLQKAFIERAVFFPEVKANPGLDKFSIMRELMNHRFVMIPGFKNISEFTSSIPKEELKNFIRELQASLQKNRMDQMRENILERELLDRVTEKRFKAMLDEGLVIPVVIGMSEKGKLKSVSEFAHVVLVTDMKEIPEGYRLTAYDPNTGINTLFVLTKKFRLEYPFYDKNYDYIPLIDKLVAEEMNLDHAVRSRGIERNKILPYLRNGSALTLETSEITRALP